MNPSLIIADDHPLVLKGLQEFLIENNYNVLASAKNGKQAYALIKAHTPDIAILDIRKPFLTGLQIAEKCKNENLNTKIILITFEKEEKIYNKAKALGVYGYVLKEFALVEIENCITSVLKNIPYFSPELLAYIQVNQTPDKLGLITKTELKVLKLITQNKTAREIGEKLFISPRTVEKHKSNIIRKLEIGKSPNSLLIWVKENENYLS